jgi:tetrahydromethanopterin S-methyltransferase subunit H
MTWNLRLVDVSEDGENYIEVCEVFYDTMGKPLGYTPATMSGENVEDIRNYVEWALEALDKPVLKFKENNAHQS